ncbi:MAG TPA: phosphoribosylaminoimidazolesuccinocarboxamide synthase [Bacteroidetes bacterium]|nr:phosphoribosylaminoimidazolesuccinocarboxamide synthase [Bacteroidota bacterium]
MKKKKKLYEGKAKILYETDVANVMIQEFKDDATAFNGKKTGRIKNKGYVNNQVSAHLFRFLSGYYIDTHFIDVLSENTMAVKRLDMIPVEVVVRNVAAGSLLKRSDYKEGEELKVPLVEYFLKDDAKGDPMLTPEEIIEQSLCTEKDLRMMKNLAIKINAVLKLFFSRRNIKLVDFKLEFGWDEEGKIVLGDEISPDTCRFWEEGSGEKLDKDRFRFDLGDVEKAYEEIRRRVFLEETAEA